MLWFVFSLGWTFLVIFVSCAMVVCYNVQEEKVNAFIDNVKFCYEFSCSLVGVSPNTFEVGKLQYCFNQHYLMSFSNLGPMVVVRYNGSLLVWKRWFLLGACYFNAYIK